MEFGNPILNISIFLVFVVVTLVVVIRVSKQNTTAADFYHGGRAFYRPAERHRHRRRLSLRRVVPRHRRRCRAVRLRRPAVLRRLPGGLAGGAAAGRGAAAQHRQVHDGGRAELPHAAAPRAHRRRDLDPRRHLLLPAGPDGRCRSAGVPADRDRGPCGPVDRDRRGGRGDDPVRHDRRDEGHHLGADHQGRPADHRRRRLHRLDPRPERLQPLRGHRPGGGLPPRRHHDPRADAPVRHLRNHEAGLRLPRDRARVRRSGPAARADALLHRALGQGGPPLGGVGDRPHRLLLPVHPGARLRRRVHGGRRRDRHAARRLELRRTGPGLCASAARC